MELYGDNSAYGSVRVDLNDRRTVLPIDIEGAPFPQGSGGLIPVINVNRHGDERTVYAFPSDAEVTDRPTIASEAECQAVDTAEPENEEPLASQADESKSPVQDCLETDPLVVLFNAIDIVNDVFEQASDLIREDLGRLVSAFIGIPDQGFGFTRVEVVDTEPGNSDSHMRLIIETSDEPGSEYTATCALDYDAKGRPDHISVVAHDTDEIGTRISASWRHDLHAFKVMKVEELDGGLLYKAPVPRKKRGTRR